MHLTYQVSNDNNGRYYVYLLKNDESNNLPDACQEAIDSFGVNINTFTIFDNDSREPILSKLEGIFSDAWDINAHGIPIFHFKGDVDKLNPAYKGPIIICFSAINEAIPRAFARTMRDLHKSTFFCDNFMSDNSETVKEFLTEQLKINHSERIYRDNHNPKLRMKAWYGNETYELLYKEASFTINEFAVNVKLKHSIDNFMIVPAGHKQRYKNAYSLLQENYYAPFIMSIPMVVGETIYLILFPLWE